MRHIPEEELHGYLDQALSRSQCVEIECHLARCIRCRHERDVIASVRDRTTALLGILGTPSGRRPAFAELMIQANSRRVEQDIIPSRPGAARVWYERGARAAGIALLISIGWSARGFVPTDSTTPRGAPQQFATGPGLTGFGAQQQQPLGSLMPSPRDDGRVIESPVSTAPDPGWEPDPIERSAPAARLIDAEPAVAPLALTVSTFEATDYSADFPAPGVWRSVSWAEAAALTGDAVPRIYGLPVVEIQVQRIGPDERPMILVAHQDASGRIIRSIEGPAERLSDILGEVSARTEGAVTNSQPMRTTSAYVGDASGTPRRSIRVAAVTGRLDATALDELAKSLAIR
jgi:hypothetical protein